MLAPKEIGDSRIWLVVWMAAAIFGQDVCVAQDAGADQPVVLTARFSTLDAPEVTPDDHGCPGQNARTEWFFAGAGTGEGHAALYMFYSILRDDAAGPPLMAQMDLADGKLREFYRGDPVNLLQKADPDLLEGLPSASPGPMKVTWCWGKPLCGAASPDGRIYLAVEAAGRDKDSGKAAYVLIYDPKANTFQEWTACDFLPAGMAFVGERLWILGSDGRLLTDNSLEGGLEPAGTVPLNGGRPKGLMADDQKCFYTAVGPAPWRLIAFRVDGAKAKVTPLLSELTFDSLSLRPNTPAPRCSAIVAKDGRFSSRQFELKGGHALPIEETAWKAVVGKKEVEVESDFSTHPLAVAVRRPGTEWNRFPIVFSRTAWDKIRTLRGAPDGKTLYGAGWPTAWIWRFDPGSGRFKIFASHYEFYEMHLWKDEIWCTGYWGIKLLRWRPDEPWTFDYDRHYGNKKYPGSSSPWGDKDVSNPRLVCKFRYLKQLHVRRPGGAAITDDGCLWVGAFTPAVEYFDSRFGGGVNWYDPATETIGQIRDPFLHHSVRDVCRAGPFHVAAAASAYISPFEPLPKDFSPGKFVLIDTWDRSVKLDCSPLNSALSYAEEGAPGRVVVYGTPGNYAGDNVRGAFFIFDTGKMKVTHVIRLPVKLVWGEYDNVMRFERGPDRRIYFYGKDDAGIALCRVDSVTGVVEPVLRGKQITDVATYSNTGAGFTFCGDRVFFGAHRLVSLPLQTVTGAPAAAGGKP